MACELLAAAVSYEATAGLQRAPFDFS
jgi:hypothetical protein